MKRATFSPGTSTSAGVSSDPKRSRSGDLLRKAIGRNDLTLEQVAERLCLQRDAIDQLLDGTKVMTLPHQLCFAELLLQHVPSLARSAHSLKSQALAAMAFSEKRTAVHSEPPGRWRPLKLL